MEACVESRVQGSSIRNCPFRISGGIEVNLLNPDLSGVSLDRIAWSLAGIRRTVGHSPMPKSVAEHCVAVSKSCSTVRAARLGLFHDAAEAFIGDIPTPVKHMSPEIIKLEKSIQKAIFTRYGISEEDWGEVKMIDESEEGGDLLDVCNSVPGWLVANPLQGLGQREAYELFMRTSYDLGVV